jgi:hypothetical protein
MSIRLSRLLLLFFLVFSFSFFASPINAATCQSDTRSISYIDTPVNISTSFDGQYISGGSWLNTSRLLQSNYTGVVPQIVKSSLGSGAYPYPSAGDLYLLTNGISLGFWITPPSQLIITKVGTNIPFASADTCFYPGGYAYQQSAALLPRLSLLFQGFRSYAILSIYPLIWAVTIVRKIAFI